MIELSNKRITYNFIADENSYLYEGYCIFNAENKIIELQANVTVHAVDEETQQPVTVDRGHVNFNAYSDDDRGTLTVYTERTDMGALSDATVALMEHLKESAD